MVQMLKCKKSVFCVLFLICFFTGTICGVLLFNFVYSTHAEWSASYFDSLLLTSDAAAGAFFTSLAPLVFVYFLSLLPAGKRLLPVCVVWRGCCASYLYCFAYSAGSRVSGFLFRELLLLACFYAVWNLSFSDREGRPVYHDIFLWLLILLSSLLSVFL